MSKGVCKHFSRGTTNCTCLKGVDFKALVECLSGNWIINIPCTRETERVLCIHKETIPDYEEIEKAIDAIRKKYDNTGVCEYSTGTMQCPYCHDTLFYTIYKNGSIRGQCKTPDCWSWMK